MISRAGMAYLGLAIALVGTSRVAHAARGGVIDVEGTPLREGPGTTYKSIDKLPKGAQVAASNLPIEGYYRVRTASGAIGFVPADSLILQPTPSEDTPPAAPPAFTPPAESRGGSPLAPSEVVKPTAATESGFRNRNSRRYLRIKALGGYNFFSVTEVNNLLGGVDVLKYGFNAGGEVDFLFTPDLALVIRVEKVFKSVFARDLKTLKSFQFDVSSYPTMAGLELTLTSDTKFSTHFAVMGGLAVLTDLSALDLSDPEPNLTDQSSTTFTGLARLDLAYNFTRSWSIFGEIGYRYLKTLQMTPGDSQNGSQIFKDANTGAYIPLSVDLSGPFVGGGISFTF